jgi:Dolichyl-phosphate-mannose-protein mannosyltransferase
VSQIADRPVEIVPAEDRPAEPRRTPDDRPTSRLSTADRAVGWWRRHPDLAPLTLILAIGLLLRLALLYRVPPLFMPGDSQSFLTPAYDLARGLGFDPILKRPLGYPLLLAGVIASLGEDPRGLVFVQAMLGLVTVAATYWIGRLVFGRAAAIVAALSVAIGGQLVIYEHYVLAESVFAMLLALAVLALVAAPRQSAPSWRLAASGGAALAVASLFRPIAEVIVPLLPLYFLAVLQPPRRALVLSAVAIAAFLATMAPALLADLALRGSSSSGALGEHLLWRITRADSGYVTRADIPPDQPGSTTEAAARRYVIRKAVDRALPQEIFTGLRRELGLSPAETDAVMRAVALEAIGRQPLRYLTSTARMSFELFFGEDQRLGEVSKRAGEPGYIDPQSKQRTWFEDRVLHLGEPPTQAVENEFGNAESLTSIYQPGRILWLIAAGFLIGAALTVVSPQFRPGLLLVLAIPPMLLANAALAGPEARFRYPLDPLIAVVAFGGLAWLAQLAWKTARHRDSASQVVEDERHS